MIDQVGWSYKEVVAFQCFVVLSYFPFKIKSLDAIVVLENRGLRVLCTVKLSKFFASILVMKGGSCFPLCFGSTLLTLSGWLAIV